jgi:HSP20 family protein
MLMGVDPFDQIDHLLRSTLNGVRTVMPMDTHLRGDEFIAELDLPGVDRDSIEVTVERNVLQISARRDAHYDEADEVGARERRHGVLRRRRPAAGAPDQRGGQAAHDPGHLGLEPGPHRRRRGCCGMS